ncbi:MAG TPA: DUF5989 family protein [Verrucomicrobiae bacterium]|nr:DUF5989 family protein [Verrucomicrobiae bacterium]
MNDPIPTNFEKAVAERRGRGGLFADLCGFLKGSKKWWLLPIIAVLLIFALFVFLSGTGLAPFIYTLF